MQEVRVRFAPSPTGTLHIGGARTALFNYLFARSMAGKFILRLEDTDLSRSSEDSALGILEGLSWLGLDWDEGPGKDGSYGPYRQSERLSIYKEYLQRLIDSNKAYYCFCSPEEIQQQREQARLKKLDYKYSGKCQDLSSEEAAQRLQQGEKAVIRLRVPTEGTTTVKDLIRGNVRFNNSLLDDFIIAKSDGWPTYNFAVVVDDHTMKISHVIRAEEHLSNTPKQLHIYEALNITPPEFAHVSMILAPDRSKLSKRHGATSVQEFRTQGFLPEALLNYLALLGWSMGEDLDFLILGEMVQKFQLDNVSRSPAIYDTDKLAWMNGHYLGITEPEKILSLIEDEAKQRGWLKNDNKEYFIDVIKLIHKRIKMLSEFWEHAEYFFADFSSYDEKGKQKYFLKGNSVEILTEVLESLEKIEPFNSEAIEASIRKKAEKMNLKAAELIHPIRLALTGRTKTPGLFEIMEVLGKNKCLQRIKTAIDYIKI